MWLIQYRERGDMHNSSRIEADGQISNLEAVARRCVSARGEIGVQERVTPSQLNLRVLHVIARRIGRHRGMCVIGLRHDESPAQRTSICRSLLNAKSLIASSRTPTFSLAMRANLPHSTANRAHFGSVLAPHAHNNRKHGGRAR
jgi:hypothetical protein